MEVILRWALCAVKEHVAKVMLSFEECCHLKNEYLSLPVQLTYRRLRNDKFTWCLYQTKQCMTVLMFPLLHIHLMMKLLLQIVVITQRHNIDLSNFRFSRNLAYICNWLHGNWAIQAQFFTQVSLV